MPAAQANPPDIAGYSIVPITLPPLTALPLSTTHYLYLAPHNPKIPTATATRSLFLINVPFDATDDHIKHLFSSQLGLSHGRIENVQLAAERNRAMNNEESSNSSSVEKRGKKRKRAAAAEPIEEYGNTTLPRRWDRILQPIGGTAVVVFVDRASMDAALKAVKGLRKERRELVWAKGIEDQLPALGSESSSPILVSHASPDLHI